MTQDTAIGGPAHCFPETRHSAIRALREDDPNLRRQSYELIVAAYWKPVYKYVRLRWNQSNEQAKDFTQSFFASALEKDTLTRYDPSRATFRTYLRICLDSFVLNALKHETREKRTGELPPSAPAHLDDLFHREWVRAMFEMALADLRISSEQRHRQLAFQVFEAYDLRGEDSRPSYAELASRFGITVATVTNYLAAMRRDFRNCVLSKLRELTATDREFQSEARSLLGVDHS
jgi:RNA polymerase sigma factor (sigma-70 family)